MNRWRRSFRRLRARFRRRPPEPLVRSFHSPALYHLRKEGHIRDLTEEDLRPRPRRPRKRFLDRKRRFFITDDR
jgi:hypothetical protein